MTGSRPVVVGYVDDSAGIAALRVALSEASLRGTSVTVMHGLAGTDVPERFVRYGQRIDKHRATVARLLRTVNEIAPDAPHIDIDIVSRAIADELVLASKNAALIVLGVTTRHPAMAAAFDTVPRELVRRSHSPVLLIPADSPERAGAQIICGIDRSPASASALRWAADEAARRGVTVHAVEVLATASDQTDEGDAGSLQTWVREKLQPTATTVVCTAEVARPQHRLLEIASRAHGLLVIGAHERSGWRPASVARVVTSQIRVPVAVIPSDEAASDANRTARTPRALTLVAAGQGGPSRSHTPR